MPFPPSRLFCPSYMFYGEGDEFMTLGTTVWQRRRDTPGPGSDGVFVHLTCRASCSTSALSLGQPNVECRIPVVLLGRSAFRCGSCCAPDFGPFLSRRAARTQLEAQVMALNSVPLLAVVPEWRVRGTPRAARLGERLEERPARYARHEYGARGMPSAEHARRT